MVDAVDRFVEDLGRAETGDLINQYACEVDGLDRPGAAGIRRANLRAYLETRIGARLALIGEAPSARGARFSGIAFTAERSLGVNQRTSAIGLKPNGFAEYSATVLGRALATAEIDPLEVVLWNAVPFHPAQRDDPLRNRHPSPEEVRLGIEWLDRFREVISAGQIVAVGQTARRALPAGVTTVRHPANGGSDQLTRDLAALAASLGIGG